MVEGRIGKVDVVFLRHAVLGQTQALTEPLEVDHLPLAQELDDVVHVRVVAEAEDVVVGHPGLLLWCDLVRTTFFVDGIGFLYVVCYYVDRSSNMSKLHLKGI